VRAARVVGEGRLEAVEVPVSSPGEGEVLVRLERVSVCGSDLHIVYDGFHRQGYPGPPGFPGHEGVGRVADSRSPQLRPGDWVLSVPAGQYARCFAEFQVVGERYLVPLPDGGDPASLLMAQQLGTVVNAFRRFWPPGTQAEGKTAGILGAGSAGLFFLQLAKLAGFSQAVVADLSPLRLKLAESLGADWVVRAPEESFAEVVHDLTGGEGADLVVEAVGFDATRIQALEAVRRAGRVGYFGFPEHPEGPSSWSFNLAWRKIPTIDVVTGTQAEPGLRSFREALSLIHSGQVPVEHLLEPCLPLEEVQHGFELAREQRAGKVSFHLGG
jgi:L-iditol 2-dehydrogenase